MSDRDWLSYLKVGDRVIVIGSGLDNSESIGVVKRITANFFVVTVNTFDTKFRKESGWSTGDSYRDSYYHKYLKEATQEAVTALFLKIKQRNIQRYMEGKVAWATVPKDVIEQLYELLDPFVKEDKTNK